MPGPVLTTCPNSRAKILIYDYAGTFLADATLDVQNYTGVEDTPEGCGAGTLQIGLFYEQIIARGYWVGRNLVELYEETVVLTHNFTTGDTKIYVDSNTIFDPNCGFVDQAQIYLTDGTNTSPLLQITGIGTDSNGDYVTYSAVGGGTVPNFSATNTTIGRRVYCGIIIRREMKNSKDPICAIYMQGLIKRLDEVLGLYAIQDYDVGDACYNVCQEAQTKWPELTVDQGNFKKAGYLANFARDKCSVRTALNQIISFAKQLGDDWAIRVGHDRVIRLVKLFDAASETYLYNVTLYQGSVDVYEALNVQNHDQDCSRLYNVVEALGDTNPLTKQPCSAIDLDSSSISTIGRIEAPPVTNTALKTDEDCASFAAALLKQNSIPRTAAELDVYGRNDPSSSSTTPLYTGVEFVTWIGKWWQFTSVPPQVSSGTGGDLTAPLDAYNSSMVVDYDSSGGPVIPIPGASGSTLFYARLVGQFTASFSGVGQLGFLSDDGANLIVNGTKIISHLGQASAHGTYDHVPFTFVKGQTYQVVIEWANLAPSFYQMIFSYSTPSAPGVPITVQPIVTTRHKTSLQGSVVLGVHDVVVTGFEASAPDIFGLVQSVQTNNEAAKDILQHLKFSAIVPDAKAEAAERANALNAALRANTQVPAYLDQFIVSNAAFSFTESGLVVTWPIFAAQFGPSTAPVQLGNKSATMTANTSNWVWVDTNNNFTVKQDPSIVANAILLTVFRCDATSIIGHLNKASVGVIDPTKIVGAGNQNLIPDSGWISAPYHSDSHRGIIAALDPNWYFNLIDGITCFLSKTVAHNGSNSFVNGFGQSTGHRLPAAYAISQHIAVFPGAEYNLACFVDSLRITDGGTIDGRGMYIAICDANEPSINPGQFPTQIYAFVSQSLGQASTLNVPWQCPTDGSVTTIRVMLFFNNCLLQNGLDNPNFSQPSLMLGGTPLPYAPGPLTSTQGEMRTTSIVIAPTNGSTTNYPNITAGFGPPSAAPPAGAALYMQIDGNGGKTLWEYSQISGWSIVGGIIPSLEQLTDVQVTSIQDGDLLQYDASLGKWVNIKSSKLTVNPNLIVDSNFDRVDYAGSTFHSIYWSLSTADVHSFFELVTLLLSQYTGSPSAFWDSTLSGIIRNFDSQPIAVIPGGEYTLSGFFDTTQ